MILRCLELVLVIAFFGTIPVFIRIQGGFNYYWDYVSSQFQDETFENYDFIVVGAGSTGSVVANRLSKNHKVLLLEAGGDPLFYHSIPALAPEMLHLSGFDWGYKTVPQTLSSLAMVEQRSAWPRGKVLGGSSTINYMLYNRGNPLDFDDWANMTGDPTWKYENVLPFFKKSLDYRGLFSDNKKHYGEAAYGNLQVESPDLNILTFRKYWLEAARELGYDYVDFNGPQREGFGNVEFTMKNGRRFGTYDAFILPALHRKNLVVSRYSHVTKIKLDEFGRAVGVWYVRHGVKKFARATKEIIISGGTIGSAQLLMLSGIGPKEHLKSVGVKPRIDLPVGKNLKDHIGTFLIQFIIDKPISFLPARDMGLKVLTDYFFRGTGVLRTPVTSNAQAFLRSPSAKKLGKTKPDLQLYILASGIGDSLPADMKKLANMNPAVSGKFVETNVGKDAFGISVGAASVESAGEITLQDKNPLSHPRIDPNYLGNPNDLKILMEGVQIALDLVEKTESFKPLNVTYSTVPFPGCEKLKFRSSEYWECYIRHFTTTTYHHCGTCSMGKGPDDPKAVVDSRLRVLKTKGLRVADASIMPAMVNANTNAPCIMIGEKAADFIREYWSEHYLICNSIDRLLGNEFKTCAYSLLV